MIKNKQGFTLVELVLTMGFIAIILLSSTLVFVTAVKVGKLSGGRYEAMNLATKIVEDLQNYDYDTLDGVFAYTSLPAGFTGEVEVQDEELDGTGKPLLKEVTVTVNWLKAGLEQEINLTTYMARR